MVHISKVGSDEARYVKEDWVSWIQLCCYNGLKSSIYVMINLLCWYYMVMPLIVHHRLFLQLRKQCNFTCIGTSHHSHVSTLRYVFYKSFKSHLGKVISLGQCLLGNFWVARKKKLPRILKVPYERSMSLHNKEEGFHKCGIFPFNLNVVDKTHFLRNKLHCWRQWIVYSTHAALN